MNLRFVALLFAPLSLIPPAPALAAVQQRALSQRDMFLIQTVVFQASSTQAALTRRYDATLVVRSKEIAGLISKLRSQQTAQRMATRASASLRDENNRLEAEIIKLAKSFNDQLAAKDTEFARERERLERAALYMMGTPQGKALIESSENGTAQDAARLLAELGRVGGEIGAAEAIKQGMEVLSSRLGRPGYTVAFMIEQWAAVPDRYRDHWDWVQLWRLHLRTGNLQSAISSAEEALRTAANLRDRALALDAVGIANMQANRPEIALQNFLAAQTTFSEATANTDLVPWERRDIAVGWANIGRAQSALGRNRDAMASFNNALSIYKAFSQDQSRQINRGLAALYQSMGDLFFKIREKENAIDSYKLSRDHFLNISKLFGDDLDNIFNLAIIYTSIGDFNFYERISVSNRIFPQFDGRDYLESIHYTERLISVDPKNSLFRRQHSISLENIGDSHSLRGNVALAVERYQESLAIRAALASEWPLSSEAQRDLAVNLFKLSGIASVQFPWRRAFEQFQLMGKAGMLAESDRPSLETARQHMQQQESATP